MNHNFDQKAMSEPGKEDFFFKKNSTTIKI